MWWKWLKIYIPNKGQWPFDANEEFRVWKQKFKECMEIFTEPYQKMYDKNDKNGKAFWRKKNKYYWKLKGE